MAISDGADAFTLVAQAHNIAEKYQIPVIFLTDKYIAECLFCVAPYDTGATVIDRGWLVMRDEELAKLSAADRYRVTKDGISPRWLPGARAPGYDANSDEHTEDGTVTEDREPVRQMLGKRMRKMEALERALPEPTLFRMENGKWIMDNDTMALDMLLVGWGSTKGPVLDVLEAREAHPTSPSGLRRAGAASAARIGYLHYTYLWPLKTQRFAELTKQAKRTILIEGNYQGQLGILLRQKTGMEIREKLLKYDGRPFFFEELRDALLVRSSSITSHP
jgi:2-oxoglutarate ferredoxin oxidoreductase subunit alpha